MSALCLGLAGPGFATVSGHSPELCSFDEILLGHGNGTCCAIPTTESNRRPANPTNGRRPGCRFGWQTGRAAFSFASAALSQPCGGEELTRGLRYRRPERARDILS